MLLLVVVVSILWVIGVLRAAAQLGMARLCELPVDQLRIGFGPVLWQRTARATGTIFQVTWIPFGAFVRLRDEGHAAWRRLAAVSAALAGTYLAVSLIALGFFASHGVDEGRRWIGVHQLMEGYDAAGKLAGGDRIVAVDGEPLYVDAGVPLSERVNAREGAPVTLTIRRDGATRDVAIAPRRDDRGIWRLGIRPTVQVDRTHDVGTVIARAICYPVAQVTVLARGWSQAIQTPEQVDTGGPIRLVHELDRALEASWAIGFQLAMSLVVYLTMFLVGFDLIRLALAAIGLVRTRRAA